MRLRRLLVSAVAVAVVALAAPAAARASVFDGAGAFVADPRNLPGPWGLACDLADNGFTWVALRIHDGTAAEAPDPMWIAAFRARGIAVGGWGVERKAPRAEAALAAQLVDRYGLDFYIANAEWTYRRDTGGWTRSRAFARAFRAREPDLPAALVTYGAAPAPHVLPLDFAAWRSRGFELLPEAYWNQWPQYRPDLTVAHARRAGWRTAQVHPVLGVYRRFPAVRYLPWLRRAGTRGFSVFLADQARHEDYAALARVIARPSGGEPGALREL